MIQLTARGTICGLQVGGLVDFVASDDLVAWLYKYVRFQVCLSIIMVDRLTCFVVDLPWRLVVTPSLSWDTRNSVIMEACFFSSIKDLS